ncbi:TraR/DksA C4-type zinc finger protein [Luteibacter aegosomatis]|uniref:TraR/DksA C4-type zinc finger protein n=1 Tax=Luteibacter aegosomatis TaxID=2911537 RepID=UPI001FFBBB4D|nr:TraR/DksA C4-type zinc finger protein [Luteibacter aegosomatis]UPG87014.1 TraR/DksA C4-type zinc finger protein [Luteibacter aegosomatis]
MDELEIASAQESADREALINLQLLRGRVARAPAKHAADGRRICVHCGEPIAEKRLAAVPHATACRDCETMAEQHAAHYVRRNAWAV